MLEAPLSINQLESHIAPQVGLVWRVVETQETAATRAITKNAEAQSRLEELLDSCKPPVPEACQQLSYLLMTPFRYPPLKYGSRYGTTVERGIFYAAKEQQTALAETAVYLWLFQSGPVETGPLSEFTDSRTLFSVRLRTRRGCDLSSPAFAGIRTQLTRPDDWGYTQQLGAQLRGAGVEFFWFPSARLGSGTNAAVLDPKAFASTRPDSQELWNLRLSSELCWFGKANADRDDNAYFEFNREQFEIRGLMKHHCL